MKALLSRISFTISNALPRWVAWAPMFWYEDSKVSKVISSLKFGPWTVGPSNSSEGTNKFSAGLSFLDILIEV